MLRDRDRPPPSEVLAAFGATGDAVRLRGGFDGAWRCGPLVLKRSAAAHAALAAEESILASVTSSALRVQRLHRTLDGALQKDGWIARDYLDGAHDHRRWADILRAGDALNAALREVTAADAAPLVSGRTDPWAVADRIAWGEEPMPVGAAFAGHPLPSLVAARRPIGAPAQLVHGDLSGNVLFADSMPPAVIDFSAYWRPALWAQSIAAADCVMWFGADTDLVTALGSGPELGQCLVRAIIFRHVTGLLLGRGTPSGTAATRYAALVDAAISLA